MFTILAIIGGLFTALATGAAIGEVTGKRKVLSELPRLSLPTIEDNFDDEGIDVAELEVAEGEEGSDEEETEDVL